MVLGTLEAQTTGIEPMSSRALPLIRTLLMVVVTISVIGLIVFGPAGRLDWIAGWLYIAVAGINFAINLNYLNRVNPGIVEARTRLGRNTKAWDIVWSALYAPVFCSIYVVAGFDAVRYGWTTMSPWLWPVGLALFVPGTALFSWAMGVNPFFEKTVRIQRERGHRVIDTGPYRYVRHPGYVGFLSWCLATPLMLGSWWAFLPGALSAFGIIVRTALEDRTLRVELEGYEDYTRRTRYRLLPGVW
ncbi:MAG: isoprenylcysteine carboxylmethyltransferase family protein [Gammaproteobacteria bacterium]